MEGHNFQPGDLVVTNFSGYQHWSIVSDRVCKNGQLMLISATKRNGTVKEEPYEVVTQGAYSYKVTGLAFARLPSEVISLARTFENKWNYSLLSANCEHFARYIACGEYKSEQVSNGVSASLFVGTAISLAIEKPKAGMLLLLTALAGVTAVYLSKGESSGEYLYNN